MPNTKHNAATETEETARIFILHDWIEAGYLDITDMIAPEETVREAIERFLADVLIEQEDPRYEVLAEQRFMSADRICASRDLIEAALADDSNETLDSLLTLAVDGTDPAVKYTEHHVKVIVGRSWLEAAEKAGRPITTEFYNKARGLLLKWYVDLAAEERQGR
jgi:hypothetical protein